MLKDEIETAMKLVGMTDLMADASPRYLNTKPVDSLVHDRENGYLRERNKIKAKI